MGVTCLGLFCGRDCCALPVVVSARMWSARSRVEQAALDSASAGFGFAFGLVALLAAGRAGADARADMGAQDWPRGRCRFIVLPRPVTVLRVKDLLSGIAPLIAPAIVGVIVVFTRLMSPNAGRRRALVADFKQTENDPQSKSAQAADAAYASFIDRMDRVATSPEAGQYIRSANVATLLGACVLGGAVASARFELGADAALLIAGIALLVLAVLGYGTARRKDRVRQSALPKYAERARLGSPTGAEAVTSGPEWASPPATE